MSADEEGQVGKLPLAPRHDPSIEAALTVVLDQVRSESERETNLNARAGLVAATAGLLATVAAGLAKFIFQELESFRLYIAVAAFVLALSAAVLSALLVILFVLRPKKLEPEVPGRRFLAGKILASADPDRTDKSFSDALSSPNDVRRWYLDHAIPALGSWWERNNQKQQYLRLSWGALGVAIALLAVTGVVVATDATWFALGIAAVAGVLVALALIFAPARARALEKSDARREGSADPTREPSLTI